MLEDHCVPFPRCLRNRISSFIFFFFLSFVLMVLDAYSDRWESTQLTMSVLVSLNTDRRKSRIVRLVAVDPRISSPLRSKREKEKKRVSSLSFSF